MDVGSPSSVCSALSTDRSRRTARRRSSRRQRPSLCQTTANQQAETAKESTLPAATNTRTASWATNFDNLLHDCAGLATFSVSDESVSIAFMWIVYMHELRNSSSLASVVWSDTGIITRLIKSSPALQCSCNF